MSHSFWNGTNIILDFVTCRAESAVLSEIHISQLRETYESVSHTEDILYISVNVKLHCKWKSSTLLSVRRLSIPLLSLKLYKVSGSLNF